MGETTLHALFRQPMRLLHDIKLASEKIDVYQQECRKLCACLDTLQSCMQRAIYIIRKGSDRFCEHPTCRIVDDTTHTLELCFALIGKCTKSGLLTRLFTITTAAEFKKAESSVESAIANINWLLNSVTDEEEGSLLGMPPIASAFPNLSVVWSLLSKLKGGTQELREAAAIDVELMSSASEQNCQFIIEEGGIPLLLKALEDGTLQCKVMVATTLCNLAINQKQVHVMVQQGTIPACVSALQQGSRQVQIVLIRLLSEMMVQDGKVQTVLGDAKGVVHFAALLLETMDDDIRFPKAMPLELLVYHSLQEVANLEDGTGSSSDFPHTVKNKANKHHHRPPNISDIHRTGSVVGSNYAYNKEDEKTADLQVQVMRALSLLAADHLDNSRRITETRAMLGLAKLIELAPNSEVQKYAVMTIMELAAVAEKYPDFRKVAFKLSSPAAKATLTQLHQMILNDSADPQLQVWCIKAIGSLARSFSTKDNNVIKALVQKLSYIDKQHFPVIIEAINALLKFTNGENYLSHQHCLAILDVAGLPLLTQLIALESEKSIQFPAILLMSHLVLRVGRERLEAFREAATLSVLKSVAFSSSTVKQYIVFSSQDDISQAVFHLEFCEMGEVNVWSSLSIIN